MTPLKKKTIRSKLIDRDGMKCCWCGRVTSLQLSPFADLFCTIEHLVRLTDGGQTSLDNCKLACRKCNTTRYSGPSRLLEYAPQLPYFLKSKWKRAMRAECPDPASLYTIPPLRRNTVLR